FEFLRRAISRHPDMTHAPRAASAAYTMRMRCDHGQPRRSDAEAGCVRQVLQKGAAMVLVMRLGAE
ncbi:hypothetical protein, partial [Mesorhizobium sp.]|uniref:hypothetical protein n=1 Tax=Mesorhizobium sp. TaxID=1871066 RepID=UPI00257E1141